MSLNFSSPDCEAINSKILIEQGVNKLGEIWTSNDLNRCIKFIREKFLNRICLQFSDEILSYAVEIEEQLKKHVDSNIFVLADTSYGSCCVDEVIIIHLLIFDTGSSLNFCILSIKNLSKLFNKNL